MFFKTMMNSQKHTQFSLLFERTLFLFISIAVSSFLFSCGGNDSQPLPVTVPNSPSVTSFSPQSGPVGTTVTITGSNFSPTPASNVVRFNNTSTTVSAASATSLTVIVPTGATTGKITVAVASLTATSNTDFTVVTVANPPSVTSFSPQSGPVGTTVTITGSNFSPTPASNVVRFNNTSTTVSAASATSLTVTVPMVPQPAKLR
jgi:hypothetical protein